MILYRLSGRIAVTPGGGLLWAEPVVGTNCAEVQKAASKALKKCAKAGLGYHLRLQRLTLRSPTQAIAIKMFITEDVNELIEKAETLEHWRSE